MHFSQRHRLDLRAALVCLAIVLSGCAGAVKNMRAAAPEDIVDTPQPGKALVIFMRPSTVGFGVQSSVFDVRDDTPVLVGILAAKKKLAYQADPGEHLFMVIGESADYMSAELEANKTYYARITPRVGWVKARFSLAPVAAQELDSTALQGWLDACEWVAKSPDSDAWAGANMASIRSKHAKYHTKWTRKADADRPRLEPQDGR